MESKICFSIFRLNFFGIFQETSGEDTSDLFLEEREKEIQTAQEEKMKKARDVPGILNPYEVTFEESTIQKRQLLREELGRALMLE